MPNKKQQIQQPTQIKIMPPKPNLDDQIELTNEIAKAKTVMALTDVHNQQLEMLSNISDFDVEMLSLLLNVAEDKSMNIGLMPNANSDSYNDLQDNYLREYVYHKLRLRNSVPAKKAGRRSEQLVEIVKNEIMKEANSVFNKIRERF